MTRKQALTALRDAMVDGTFTDMTPVYKMFTVHAPAVGRAHSGDMNAALAFVAAVLPGWKWSSAIDAHNERWVAIESPCGDYETDEVYAPTPALALTIAALNALIELEDAK